MGLGNDGRWHWKLSPPMETVDLYSGSDQAVHGELYSVSARSLARMDELEGSSRAHYERLPIKLVPD
ncbi:Gamma-glutamylcyclotransferase, AIG2-like [Sesbania bispinosa]|nr:Gamma-glutamylcyclotransferase, AIG2-like [Sesbania bispinosa]